MPTIRDERPKVVSLIFIGLIRLEYSKKYFSQLAQPLLLWFSISARNGLPSFEAAFAMAVNKRSIWTSGKEFMRKLCHFGHPNFIPVLGDVLESQNRPGKYEAPRSHLFPF
jgi:hypothetical protein